MIRKPKLKKKPSKKSTKKLSKRNPIKLKKNYLDKGSEIAQLGLSRDLYECTICGAKSHLLNKIKHDKKCPPETHYLIEDDPIGDRIHRDFGKLGQRPRLVSNYRRGW